MARITVDDCLDKIPNRFELTLVAAYRAFTAPTWRRFSEGRSEPPVKLTKPVV